MSRPMDKYLDQLRASLRTRPAETAQILAEAEDHLRESVAAGLRAGLTEVEAEQAAISAFGSVRAVVRAHQPRHARAVAVLGGCAVTSWRLAGLFLLTFGLSSLLLITGGTIGHGGAAGVPFTGLIMHSVAVGAAGLLLLTGCHLVRRFRRRGAGTVAAPAAGYFPLVAVIVFGAGAIVEVLLVVSGAIPLGGPTILACLALAAGYAVRIRRTPRRRGTAV